MKCSSARGPVIGAVEGVYSENESGFLLKFLNAFEYSFISHTSITLDV